MEMAVGDLDVPPGRGVKTTGRRRAGLGSLALRVALSAAVAALTDTRRTRRRTAPPPRREAHADTAPRHAHVRAAQRMNRAAGLLAISVLADSGVEHYRGCYHNPAMYGPLASSTLSLAASGHASIDHRPAAHPIRDSIYGVAFLTGVIGTCFHLYNIGKRPGGFSWLNLFYAAPIGAPAALSLSGLLGVTAERVRDNPGHRASTVLGVPAGRATAAVTAVGFAGTIAEVGLLHFRGAFHNPAMYLPVTIPPISAALLAEAAAGRRRPRPWARRWLRLTAWLGLAGAAFHAFGIARNMGGWRNWRQNILNGPPLPAPPSFTALSLAGLGALDLLEESDDA